MEDRILVVPRVALFWLLSLGFPYPPPVCGPFAARFFQVPVPWLCILVNWDMCAMCILKFECGYVDNVGGVLFLFWSDTFASSGLDGEWSMLQG